MKCKSSWTLLSLKLTTVSNPLQQVVTMARTEHNDVKIGYNDARTVYNDVTTEHSSTADGYTSYVSRHET